MVSGHYSRPISPQRLRSRNIRLGASLLPASCSPYKIASNFIISDSTCSCASQDSHSRHHGLVLGSCVTCDTHTHPIVHEVTRRSGEYPFPLHISSHLGWHTIVRLVGYTVLNRDSCMSYYVLPIRYFMTDFQTLPICNYHRSCNHSHHL
jgi:hypothetical protein